MIWQTILKISFIALWSNPIIAADAKEFAIIKKIFNILSELVPEFVQENC